MIPTEQEQEFLKLATEGLEETALEEQVALKRTEEP